MATTRRRMPRRGERTVRRRGGGNTPPKGPHGPPLHTYVQNEDWAKKRIFSNQHTVSDQAYWYMPKKTKLFITHMLQIWLRTRVDRITIVRLNGMPYLIALEKPDSRSMGLSTLYFKKFPPQLTRYYKKLLGRQKLYRYAFLGIAACVVFSNPLPALAAFVASPAWALLMGVGLAYGLVHTTSTPQINETEEDTHQENAPPLSHDNFFEHLAKSVEIGKNKVVSGFNKLSKKRLPGFNRSSSKLREDYESDETRRRTREFLEQAVKLESGVKDVVGEKISPTSHRRMSTTLDKQMESPVITRLGRAQSDPQSSNHNDIRVSSASRRRAKSEPLPQEPYALDFEKNKDVPPFVKALHLLTSWEGCIHGIKSFDHSPPPDTDSLGTNKQTSKDVEKGNKYCTITLYNNERITLGRVEDWSIKTDNFVAPATFVEPTKPLPHSAGIPVVDRAARSHS